MSGNYYEILGITKKASDVEIRKAFAGMAKENHSDHNKAPEAEEKFQQIHEAYLTLSNPELKKEYDLTMRNPGFSKLELLMGVKPETELHDKVRELQVQGKPHLIKLFETIKAYREAIESRKTELAELGKKKWKQPNLAVLSSAYGDFIAIRMMIETKRSKQESAEKIKQAEISGIQKNLKPFDDFNALHRERTHEFKHMWSSFPTFINGIDPKAHLGQIKMEIKEKLTQGDYNFDDFYSRLDKAVPFVSGFGKGKNIKDAIDELKLLIKNIHDAHLQMSEDLSQLGVPDEEKVSLNFSQENELRRRLHLHDDPIEAMPRKSQERRNIHQGLEDMKFDLLGKSQTVLIADYLSKEQYDLLYHVKKYPSLDLLEAAISDESLAELKSKIDAFTLEQSDRDQRISELEAPEAEDVAALQKILWENYVSLRELSQIKIHRGDITHQGFGILTIYKDSDLLKYEKAIVQAERLLGPNDGEKENAPDNTVLLALPSPGFN